jgi:hypothetical protein
MRLARHGLGVDVPRGWDARIYRREAAEPGSTTRSIMHAATFALPEEREDFGGGAVELMREQDVLVMLVEYDPAAATTPLFAREGMPRELPPSVFGATRLQRALPGQAGTQIFFNEGGRAFCLYVVIGSAAGRANLAARVNAILAAVELDAPTPGRMP